MNFAIFSYKIAMQIYFKSLIAPNMLLCRKKKQKIKNRNPYSKLDGPLKITNHVTLLQNNTTTKYLKTTKKKSFFFLLKK